MELLPFTIPEEITKVGRPLDYTPEQLANKFVEFLEWCKTHPIPIGKSTVNTKGESFDEVKDAPRMVSVAAFLVYIGKGKSWWAMLDSGEHGDEFLTLKSRVREYCENYQVEMASTGLFKENIISRLLGLADKQNSVVEIGATDEKVPRIKITTRK